MSTGNQILENQIREIYGRVVYTHKTHEKCAEILESRSNNLKIVEILLSALTTTSILVALFGDGKISQLIATIFSTCSLCLTLYLKDYNLMATAEKHKQSALNILIIREKLFSLIVDLNLGETSIVDLQKRRDELNEELANSLKVAPNTFSKAYKKASIALQENEEFTFSAREIDNFLPENLRRNSNRDN